MADEMTDQLSPRLPGRVTTERLVLRRWQHDDVGRLQAAVNANLEHLRPWMPWIAKEPLTRAERVRLIEEATQLWEQGGDVNFGVFLDGDLIGSCGLHHRVGPGAVEIGYWIDERHVGRGFATELTAALTSAVFAQTEIERVEVHTDEANTASANVPAKLGFHRERIDTREPTAPGECGRLIIWTTTRDTWQPPPVDADRPGSGGGHGHGAPNESR